MLQRKGHLQAVARLLVVRLTDALEETRCIPETLGQDLSQSQETPSVVRAGFDRGDKD